MNFFSFIFIKRRKERKKGEKRSLIGLADIYKKKKKSSSARLIYISPEIPAVPGIFHNLWMEIGAHDEAFLFVLCSKPPTKRASNSIFTREPPAGLGGRLQ